MISNAELESLFETLAQTEGSLDDCYGFFLKGLNNGDPFRPCCVLMNMLAHNVTL